MYNVTKCYTSEPILKPRWASIQCIYILNNVSQCHRASCISIYRWGGLQTYHTKETSTSGLHMNFQQTLPGMYKVSSNPFKSFQKGCFASHLFCKCCIIWIQTTSHCLHHSYYFHLKFKRLKIVTNNSVFQHARARTFSHTHTLWITSLELIHPIKNILSLHSVGRIKVECNRHNNEWYYWRAPTAWHSPPHPMFYRNLYFIIYFMFFKDMLLQILYISVDIFNNKW